MKKIFFLVLFTLFIGAMEKPKSAPKKEEKKVASPTSQEKNESLPADLFLSQFRDMRYYHLKMKVKDAEGDKCAPYRDLLFTAIQFAALHQHKLWPTANFKPTYDEKWPVEAVYIHRAQLRVAEIIEEVCPSGHGFLESMQIISQEITDKYIEKFRAEGPWTIAASKVPDTKPEQTAKEAATLKMIIDNYGQLTGVSLNEMVSGDQPVARRLAEKISVLITVSGPDGKADPKYEAILKQMNVVGASGK